MWQSLRDVVMVGVLGISGCCWAGQSAGCEALSRERDAAVRSGNALQMEAAARRYLDLCRMVQARQMVAVAMEEVAAARRLTLRHSEALRAANACLDFLYDAAGCHAEKALALASLKMRREAMDVLESGRQAGNRELERARRDMQGSGLRRHERSQAEAEERLRIGALREQLAIRGLGRLAEVGQWLARTGGA